MAISGTTLVIWIGCFIILGILSRFFFSLAEKHSQEIEGTEDNQKGKLFAAAGWLLIILMLAPVLVLAVILISYMWFGGDYLLDIVSLKAIGLTVIGLIILAKIWKNNKGIFARI
jgi:phosphatidylglycerophosphate synthase